MNGIINLLKPPGITSAQAVAVVKRITGAKAGHAGTLDPEACGVLPIMVGRATRLFDYLTEKEKVYVAHVSFTGASDTQDATGTLIQADRGCPDEGELRAMLPRFTGNIMQRPPAFSALKQGGVTLYTLARRGLQVQAAERLTVIKRIDVLRPVMPEGWLLRITCGKGTYIRTLCHDIGQMLGKPAHMRLLIREQSGPFCIDTAITLEELENKWGEPTCGPWLVSMPQVLGHLPRLTVPDAMLKQCINGVPLQPSLLADGKIEEGMPVTLFCGGQLIGVWSLREGMLRPRTMLTSGSEVDTGK
ncbi:MAG: tRNA pseudouridine(55) synthase TruB [Clostridiales bacterium]|nr:tRNA pseudouridine(55) synthase TruB [Clostridiales bacterium]